MRRNSTRPMVARARLSAGRGPRMRCLWNTPRVAAWTHSQLAQAVRSVWAADTCSPDDVARAGWSPGNPAWGHCDITALVVNDFLGGDLMLGEVLLDGEQ